MKEFKIRCSQIGSIMAEGKTKGTLGKTAETYLKNWMLEQVFNRKKEISSKYMEKGSIMEDESIDFISAFTGLPPLEKNQTFFEDDFMNGTPDIITESLLIEVKNSWDCFTFPYFDNSCPNSDYYWQVHGYLHLTGKSAAKLIYVLSDTPLHLIEKECYWHCQRNGLDFEDELPLWVAKMTYSDVLPDDKIRIFDIQRNDEDIQRIIERVKLCREFINNLKK